MKAADGLHARLYYFQDMGFSSLFIFLFCLRLLASPSLGADYTHAFTLLLLRAYFRL